MKKKCIVILIAILCTCTISAYSQENGILLGGSYTKFSEKMTKEGTILSLGNPEFNFHAGYQYRKYLKKKFTLDFTALYGEHSGSFESKYLNNTNDNFKFRYISLGGIANYELLKDFRAGVGVEPTWYINFKSDYDNSIDPIFDIPIVAKLSYSFKSFDIALSYKYGTCNLMKNKFVEQLKSQDLQLSIYIPLFNKKR